MGSFGTDFVTTCRNARLGYTYADRFDTDVTTRFTYETFHTSDGTSDGLSVNAVALRF